MIDIEKEFDKVYSEILGLDAKIMELVRAIAKKAFYAGVKVGREEVAKQSIDTSKPLEKALAG